MWMTQFLIDFKSIDSSGRVKASLDDFFTCLYKLIISNLLVYREYWYILQYYDTDIDHDDENKLFWWS